MIGYKAYPSFSFKMFVEQGKNRCDVTSREYFLAGFDDYLHSLGGRYVVCSHDASKNCHSHWYPHGVYNAICCHNPWTCSERSPGPKAGEYWIVIGS